MKIISSKGNLFERRRRKPSGVYLIWRDNNNKIHTKSIPDKETYKEQIEIDTWVELCLIQLKSCGSEYDVSKVDGEVNVIFYASKPEAKRLYLQSGSGALQLGSAQ